LKVSGIIPNFNHAPYLKERIESVLNQTYKSFEVIILDDCSMDNSREIIKEYSANAHISGIIYNDINTGSPFAQWRKGIQSSKSDWIWIAESDDLTDFNFLDTLVNASLLYPDVDLIFCGSILINSDGEQIGSWEDAFTKAANNKSFFQIDGEQFIKQYLLYSNCIPNASAVIFKKKKDTIDLLSNNNLKLNGDWKFWVDYTKNSKVLFVNQYLNYFRKHSNTVRSTVSKDGTNLIEYKQIAEYIKKLYPEVTKEARVVITNINKAYIKHNLFKRNWKLLSQYIGFDFVKLCTLFAVLSVLLIQKLKKKKVNL
jgi:glycosyltransferase involved in cell wall biosynthesis